MKRPCLALWQRGDHAVLVELNGADLQISRKQADVVEETIALPATRALLLSLREACNQGLRRLP